LKKSKADSKKTMSGSYLYNGYWYITKMEKDEDPIAIIAARMALKL
jgi:hypothetical protein